MSGKQEKRVRKQTRKMAANELGKATAAALKKQKAFKVLFVILLVFCIGLICLNVALLTIILTNMALHKFPIT